MPDPFMPDPFMTPSWVHSLAPWQVISHLTFAWEASVWSASRWRNHDLRLFRQVWDQLKAGDIGLGDRA
jgi:hypothetical protein